MIVLFILAFLLLVVISSIVVPVESLGKFERKRRQGKGDDLEVERELYYGEILSIQRVISALLLVITATTGVAAFGWFIGIIIALVVAVEYGAVARMSWLRQLVTSQYKRIERSLFHFIKSYPLVFRIVGYFIPQSPELQLHSREELQHLIETSHGVVSLDEKLRLLTSLSFSDKLVRDIMTPRSVIDAVNNTEVLGPLVLDDLHKTGHSRIPVIEGNVDHVVGMLYLRDVLTLDSTRHKSVTVADVMEDQVYYIHEDQTLSHALAAFIKTHHHLFVVVNEYRETVGLLSLEDTTEALIGTRIIDEFDAHDDLRAVATRNPRGNNSTKTATDV